MAEVIVIQTKWHRGQAAITIICQVDTWQRFYHKSGQREYNSTAATQTKSCQLSRHLVKSKSDTGINPRPSGRDICAAFKRVSKSRHERNSRASLKNKRLSPSCPTSMTQPPDYRMEP
ncbi:hypothetical protein ECG_09202 [Echinococcus granulosus]|nr:hypothetical protein ECG_09202 [Echinococcus granulosus]